MVLLAGGETGGLEVLGGIGGVDIIAVLQVSNTSAIIRQSACCSKNKLHRHAISCDQPAITRDNHMEIFFVSVARLKLAKA